MTKLSIVKPPAAPARLKEPPLTDQEREEIAALQRKIDAAAESKKLTGRQERAS